MPLEWNSSRDYPLVDRETRLHPTAVIIGNVRIAAKVFVAPQAVIRADERGPEGRVSPVVIGEGANIQDGVVVHAFGGTGVTIGPGTSVAHRAVVHGPCRTGANCFIGFGTVVCNASLGEDVVVMHQACVEGVTIPDGMCVPSMTAVRCQEDVKSLKPVPQDLAAFVQAVRRTNVAFVEDWLEWVGRI